MSSISNKARQILGPSPELKKVENIDRNTLHTLYLLLTERNVTRTALILGVSQPAVSETLAKLRRVTGDPLLIRSGGKMELTDHAQGLLKYVQRVLGDLDLITSKRDEFDAARSRRTFRIATADNIDVNFHARLMARIRSRAPHARIEVFSLTQDFDYVRRLAERTVDIVIANWPEPPSHLHSKSLLESGIVCMMNKRHPAAKKPLTWEVYSGLAHLDITPRMLGEVSPIDHQLLKIGVHREIYAHYPFFTLIPLIVAGSDFVFTGSRRFLEHFEKTTPVVLRELPQRLTPIKFYQLWHERSHNSGELRWLRGQVAEVAKTLDTAGD